MSLSPIQVGRLQIHTVSIEIKRNIDEHDKAFNTFKEKQY